MEERFYQLIQQIVPPVGGGKPLVHTYQSCAPEASFRFRNREYSQYLPMQHPIGMETSLTSAVSLEVVLPWGNSREIDVLSSDYLVQSDFLANQVVLFITLKESDPSWFVGPVPYVVRNAVAEDNELTLTLQNPTALVSQVGGVVQQYFTEQSFGELPRSF